jgi:transposase
MAGPIWPLASVTILQDRLTISLALRPAFYDKELYKARHLIENFYCKLKQYRAIATRYDKTARNFLAGIHLAAAVIWLN